MSLETMRPLAKSFSRFILHRAGRLKQLDHSQNPSHFFFLSSRSPGTIRPLVNPFRIFFFPSGKSPETIRPLASLLSFYHRVGRLEQLDHFFQKKRKQKKINQKKRGRVFMLIFLYKTYYVKSKENEFFDAFAP
jgi:hypothetical protein